MAVLDGKVWVTCTLSDELVALDATTLQKVDVGAGRGLARLGRWPPPDGQLAVVAEEGPRLVVVDPATAHGHEPSTVLGEEARARRPGQPRPRAGRRRGVGQLVQRGPGVPPAATGIVRDVCVGQSAIRPTQMSRTIPPSRKSPPRRRPRTGWPRPWATGSLEVHLGLHRGHALAELVELVVRPLVAGPAVAGAQPSEAGGPGRRRARPELRSSRTSWKSQQLVDALVRRRCDRTVGRQDLQVGQRSAPWSARP